MNHSSSKNLDQYITYDDFLTDNAQFQTHRSEITHNTNSPLSVNSSSNQAIHDDYKNTAEVNFNEGMSLSETLYPHQEELKKILYLGHAEPSSVFPSFLRPNLPKIQNDKDTNNSDSGKSPNISETFSNQNSSKDSKYVESDMIKIFS